MSQSTISSALSKGVKLECHSRIFTSVALIMPLNYVPSQRGTKYLVHDGYRFVKDGEAINKIIWKCVEHKSTYPCLLGTQTVVIQKTGDSPNVLVLCLLGSFSCQTLSMPKILAVLYILILLWSLKANTFGRHFLHL